jgi:hypothetical protein
MERATSCTSVVVDLGLPDVVDWDNRRTIGVMGFSKIKLSSPMIPNPVMHAPSKKKKANSDTRAKYFVLLTLFMELL